jgi:integrase
MASIYKRRRMWWIKYYVGGKPIQRSLRTQNAREAETICKQYDAAETVKLLAEPSNTPIRPFLQDLCECWKKTRTGKGATNDISRLRLFFGPVCPALKYPPQTEKKHKDNRRPRPSWRDPKTDMLVPVKRLEDLTATIISAILRERFLAGEISARTTNRYRGVLSSMFTYARKHHGYICPDQRYRNPIEGVERLSEQQPVITWLNREQIDEQIKLFEPYPQLRAMVATAIFAGPRREEITWLRHDDMDLENRVLHVRAKEVDGEYWQPKTGKDRSVPISSELYEILCTYDPPIKSQWFFPSPQGARWHPDNFSARLREVNEACGLAWSCAIYRHTFGSQLAMKGVSLYKISELMGNSPEICRKHYAALLPQEMREEVEFPRPEIGEGDRSSEPAPESVQQLPRKVDRLGRPQAGGPPPRLRLVR